MNDTLTRQWCTQHRQPNQIQDGIDEIAQVKDKLLAAGVTVLSVARDQLLGEVGTIMTVSISGKLPSGKKKLDYVVPLKAAGDTLVDEVTKQLNYLVLADPASNSSKSAKARKLGVEIIA